MVHWDRMDKRDNARVWDSPISSRLVHWADKRDSAIVFGMVYHLVPFGTCTLEWDEQEGQCYSVWESLMVYHLVPFGTLGRDGQEG